MLCLQVWDEMLYNLEYRAKQKTAWDISGSWDDYLTCGNIAIDIQDILSELALRRKTIILDVWDDDYKIKA